MMPARLAESVDGVGAKSDTVFGVTIESTVDYDYL